MVLGDLAGGEVRLIEEDRPLEADEIEPMGETVGNWQTIQKSPVVIFLPECNESQIISEAPHSDAQGVLGGSQDWTPEYAVVMRRPRFFPY